MMERTKRDAILTVLIEELDRSGSWCGETHVQKATYFLQDMLQLNLGFDFVLYKHGPFSFDLRDELTAMRADDFVDLEVRGASYGPSLRPGKNAKLLEKKFPKTLQREKSRISYIASKFGDKNVIELERLATALFVTKILGREATTEARAEQMILFKPHILYEEAIHAVETVDKWLGEAENETCDMHTSG